MISKQFGKSGEKLLAKHGGRNKNKRGGRPTASDIFGVPNPQAASCTWRRGYPIQLRF